MSEEKNGTVNRAGWGCLGCGLGLLLGVVIIIAVIVLGIIGLAALVNDSDSPSSGIDQENTTRLEEEYIIGKSDDDQAKIAVIDIYGVIEFDDSTISSDTAADPRMICARIRRAAEDKKVTPKNMKKLGEKAEAEVEEAVAEVVEDAQE